MSESITVQITEEEYETLVFALGAVTGAAMIHGTPGLANRTFALAEKLHRLHTEWVANSYRPEGC
jgi:hypothetical protein